jgi:hypothetical protein
MVCCLIGYTIAEAVRITGISAGRVRRWMKGYTVRTREEARVSPACYPGSLCLGRGCRNGAQLRRFDRTALCLCFLRAGVSWRTLRTAHDRAVELLAVDHPFATQKFFTDGHTILAKVWMTEAFLTSWAINSLSIGF